MFGILKNLSPDDVIHRPLSVLLAADFYPPAPGGLEAHVRRLALGLHERGHRVTVATTGAESSEDDRSPVPVHRLGLSLDHLPGLHAEENRRFPPPWPDRRMTGSLRALVDRLRPDVIHAHGWCSASAVAAVDGAVPVVVTLHDYGLLCPMQSLLRDGHTCGHTAGVRCVRCPGSDQHPAKRLGLAVGITVGRRANRRVSRHIAVSSAVARTHRSAGVRPDPVVIPNFIDDDLPAPSPPARDRTLLFVGPSVPYKGLPVVEAAHAQLVDEGMDVTLHHVGGDRRESTPGVVRSGRLRGADLDAAYRSASVVAIAPAWEEPCPTVALEAMSWGRPIVAFAAGGLTDLVADGRSGLLVEDRRPPALANGLRRILEDPDAGAAMGAAARTRATTFTTSAVIPRIEAEYRAAIAPVPS